MNRNAAKRVGIVPIARSMALGLILLTCGLSSLRAQNAPEAQDSELTPFQTALLNYKNGHYDVARTAIDAAEKANPGDFATEILKARILTEQLDFDGAAKVLTALNGNPGITPEVDETITLAFGDLYLRQHRFDKANKFYETLLSKKPGDADLTLKVIYTRIGVSDLTTAEKLASELKPLDPDHPCYYFAKAALAQATGNAEAAEEDIQTSRTLFGIMATNRYLKTYLEVLAPSDKNALTMPPVSAPATNAAPAATKP